jgi:hypothetical protein
MSDYQVVNGGDVDKLAIKVIKLLRQGWLVLGGVVVHKLNTLEYAYMQTMYKPKPEKPNTVMYRFPQVDYIPKSERL